LPFIRYTRDKRGYEHTYVMHAYRPGQGGSRARVLYLFRSPPNLRVGRRPLDAEVTEALEHTHPDLSFDWTSLPAVPEPPRSESRDRDRSRAGSGRPPTAPDRAAPERMAAVVEDESVLGRALGAQEAARVRLRYNELVQRIARRARTPEDRDRLTERALRLNPDEWADAAAVRAGLVAADAGWEEIAAELPQRRRGRRGGRNRNGGGRPEAGAGGSSGSGVDRAASAATPVGSGIISEDGDADDRSEDAGVAGPDRAADDGRDGRRGGAGDQAPEPAAESPPPAAGDDIQGGG